MAELLAPHAATSRSRDGHVHAADLQARSVPAARTQHNDRDAQPDVGQRPGRPRVAGLREERRVGTAVKVMRQRQQVVADLAPEGLVPQQRRQPPGPLGQHLVGMLRRGRHGGEHPRDERRRHLGVGDVRHAVNKADPRLAPPERLGERVLVQRHAEPGPGGARVAVGLVFRLAHGLQALSQRQRIAVIAPRRDPVTPGRRIPRGFGPLDRRRGAHDPPSRLTAGRVGAIGHGDSRAIVSGWARRYGLPTRSCAGGAVRVRCWTPAGRHTMGQPATVQLR
jgi:hypothetical protein